MKIIGGKLKGRNFYMPADIRPSPNIMRKAIFDILGQDWSGVEFLELFAGSGAVGLEAISHGAAKVVFVERDPICAEAIEENLRILGLREGEGLTHYELMQTDSMAALKQLSRQGRKFDILFLDPPFDAELVKKVLKTLTSYDILRPDSYCLVQHTEREIPADQEGRFSVIKRRHYGASYLTVYEGH